MLAVVGDLLEDVVVRLASEPALGTDTPAVIERRRGGSAANVAAAAASAGGAVRFIGRVGDDAVGRRLVDELVAVGVDVCVQVGGRTGTVVVLVGPDGERTMLPDRGAATELIDVDPAWLDGVTWLHVPAYSLVAEPVGTTSLAMVERIRADGGRVSVDVSSVGAVEAYGTDRFAGLLGRLRPEVVFANEHEARRLPERGTWTTVVKRGADPVTVTTATNSIEVPVPPLGPVADSTGAGDAFAAGYLLAALDGADERIAAEAGIALAAQHLCR